MTNPIPGPQVAALARSAGVSDADLPAMVAIAFRESGWNADATHRNTNGTVDNGLWQINRPTLDRGLLDPVANAQAMGALYKARGLEPWTFGGHGTATYSAYLARARQAVAQSGSIKAEDFSFGQLPPGAFGIPNSQGQTDVGSAVRDAVGDPVAGIMGAVVHGIEFLTNPENWIRMGEVLLGGALLISGAWMLFGATEEGAKIESKAKDAGKVAAMAA